MKLIPTILLFFLGCRMPTGSYFVEEWVYPFWAEGTRRLVAEGFLQAPTVHPSRFLFVAHWPDERCGKDKQTNTYFDAYWDDSKNLCVYGTFSTNGQIHYCTAKKDVVIHESGHAILWALHEPAKHWRCWEHKCWPGG